MQDACFICNQPPFKQYRLMSPTIRIPVPRFAGLKLDPIQIPLPTTIHLCEHCDTLRAFAESWALRDRYHVNHKKNHLSRDMYRIYDLYVRALALEVVDAIEITST